MGLGKKIGYVRVSTIDQNPDRQLDGIQLDKKFIEYASGKTADRPQLKSMIDYVRDDDIVFVHSFDRLGRNVRDLIEIVETLTKKNVEVTFVKENLRFTGKDDAMSKLILSMLASVAEFELAKIRERQLEGIALAKKQGKYRGRKKKLDFLKIEKLKELVNERYPIKEIAKYFNTTKTTIYSYCEQHNIKRPKLILSKEQS